MNTLVKDERLRTLVAQEVGDAFYRLRLLDYYKFAAYPRLFLVCELHDCESETLFWLIVSDSVYESSLYYVLDFASEVDRLVREELTVRERMSLEEAAQAHSYESASDFLCDVVYSLNRFDIGAVDRIDECQKREYEWLFRRCVYSFLDAHEPRCVEYFTKMLWQCV
jgi:hypothetical protein